MRLLPLILLCSFFTLPMLAATEIFKNVSVIDVNCHTKFAKDPDAHPRACALTCSASGYGIFTQDGKYLKFDRKGNDEILSELKASDRKDHLRVDVAGDVEGDMLKVTSVKLL
jgi:hypothetical protein